MSYDVYLEAKTATRSYTVREVGNMTSNIGPMLSKAFGGYWVEMINNKSVEYSIPIMQEALLKMENNPDEYKVMNPANGWGGYDSALSFLRDIVEDSINHPETFIFISY